MTLTEAQRRARAQAVPVSVATGSYGISFGALSVAAGLDLWQTVALSALLFTGGSQFALIGVLGAGGAPVAGVAAASLLGVRNGIYALTMAPLLRPRGWQRLAAAHLTIDESTAVALAQDDPKGARTGFWSTGLGVFALWNLTTLIGALAGARLGDPQQYGLDAAAAAAFCALLWPRLGSRAAQATAVLAGLLALGLSGRLPPGAPVLVASLAAVAVGMLTAPRRVAP